jgi:cytochrome c oxidase cbb3-type subunit 3
MADDPKIDDVTGVETTGHEWDGIEELNNPLPAWWRLILWASIIWAVGYWIFYPAWPLVDDYSRGVFGYSSRAQVAEDIAVAEAAQAGHLAKLSEASLEDIRTDPELLEFALAGGRSAFNVNCSQCHGGGAQGFAGYPNLNDDEWLWGGTLDEIHFTISHGARNEDDEDARVSDMPAFLSDEILDAGQIADVAEHVLALSGRGTNDADAAARGAEIFAEECAACHGDNAEGMTELGAPALDNDIWLYGGDKATLITTISKSRGGVMPAWGRILDPVTVKKLAVYVHSLGGGS